MKTITLKNQRAFLTALVFIISMLSSTKELFAQRAVQFQANSNSQINGFLAQAWVWVQVILGLLCVYLIFRIVFEMVFSTETRNAGPKIATLLIVIVLWVALPTIGAFFGFTF
jgi:hypothetical protein